MTNLNKNLKVAAVVIGRNEGARLIQCLKSLKSQISQIVYVDSGSSDRSINEAVRFNVSCLSLDLTIPFTAARARNEGANFLFESYPNLKYVQFIDGDCESQPNWLEKAISFLDSHVDYAVVCGRRRERYPDRSIYNQLCDVEWDTPVGDALACGGDALFRVSAFKQVSGYNSSLIAGEEPELCFRLRASNWKIKRIAAEMTLHDADMMNIKQWWSRAKRAGYAYASSCFLHGASKERFKVREIVSIVLWVVILPIVVIFFSLYHIAFISLLVVYLLQTMRLTIKYKTLKKGWRVAFFCALSNMIAKFPQLSGLLKFIFDTLKGVKAQVIEYK